MDSGDAERCAHRDRAPEDINDAVAWLVSDEAKFITGVALPLDAGFTVR